MPPPVNGAGQSATGDAVPETDATPCPHCGTPGSGNFCPACGGSRTAVGCRICGTPLEPTDRFCTQCGAARVAPARGPAEPLIPWLVGGALSILAIVLVLRLAGAGAATPVAMANAGNGTPTGGAGMPPDISNMTPRERFDRLDDRVLSAAEKGDTTTVIQFWPMARQAYQMLLSGDRDIDARYHMANLELMVGNFAATLAEADTILSEEPHHLLGWYLRAMVAEYQQDGPARHRADSAFAAHFDAEMATGRQEYIDHDAILRQFEQELP